MHDQVTPRRRPPSSMLAWVLAATLSFGAVAGTVWVMTRDASDPRAALTQSPTEAATASPGPAPVSAPPGQAHSSAPSTQPPPPTPTVVALQGAASGRCLDVPGAVAVDGAALQIYDCTGSEGQQWTASASGELRTLGSMRLDDPSGGQPDTAVATRTCHGGPNQQWEPQADGTVRNAATGLCLDVSGEATDNGTPVIVYGCHGGDNQRWSSS